MYIVELMISPVILALIILRRQPSILRQLPPSRRRHILYSLTILNGQVFILRQFLFSERSYYLVFQRG